MSLYRGLGKKEVQNFLGGGGLKNRSMLVKKTANRREEGSEINHSLYTCNLALPTPVNESTGAFVQINVRLRMIST